MFSSPIKRLALSDILNYNIPLDGLSERKVNEISVFRFVIIQKSAAFAVNFLNERFQLRHSSVCVQYLAPLCYY